MIQALPGQKAKRHQSGLPSHTVRAADSVRKLQILHLVVLRSPCSMRITLSAMTPKSNSAVCGSAAIAVDWKRRSVW